MGNAQSSNQASLAPAIIKHIQRLGGTFTPQTDPEEVIINGFVVPEPIRQFNYDVTWPEGVTYRNDDWNRVWVWLFQPGMFFRDGMESYAYFQKRQDAVVIGEADGGNYFVLLHLDSKRPGDPSVYKIDSDPSDEGSERPVGPMSLSRFLASLKPEEH